MNIVFKNYYWSSQYRNSNRKIMVQKSLQNDITVASTKFWKFFSFLLSLFSLARESVWSILRLGHCIGGHMRLKDWLGSVHSTKKPGPDTLINGMMLLRMGRVRPGSDRTDNLAEPNQFYLNGSGLIESGSESGYQSEFSTYTAMQSRQVNLSC